MNRNIARFARTGFLVAALLSGTAAFSQADQKPADAAANDDEILVTARKRAERAFDVPVAVQAVSGAEIERRGIVNVEGIARVTPLLLIGENTGGVQGAPIAIRGFQSSDLNPFTDQSVSFNVDGVQIARSTVQRLASMDLASVEVLKGPQSLYFGKNSPAGVISLRTADPTDHLETKLSTGYEFVGREWRAEGYVSTPLSDTLGIRVAGYYSDIGGYIHNHAVATAGATKQSDRSPKGHELAGRVTLKFTPGDNFDAKLKVSYSNASDIGVGSLNQLVACANATAQLNSANMDCIVDRNTSLLDPGASYNTLHPTKKGGLTYSDRSQILTSLEMNVDVTDQVKLTSVTGVYRYHSDSLENVNAGDIAGRVLATHQKITFSDINQEFRTYSSFDGPLNFAAGVTFQSGKIDYTNFAAQGVGGPTGGAKVYDVDLAQRGESYSAFGQAIFKPIDLIEFSAGGRWTHETKRIRTISSGVEQIPALSEKSWRDFTPEATLTVHALPNVNVFLSYREGFLSGGFDGSGTPNYTGRNMLINPQTIDGFEGGVKARLLNNTLNLNFTAFDYNVKGMVVSVSSGTSVITTNAGASYLRGVEFDANWRTPIEGLSLRGALSYNKSRYKDFTFSCYAGQSISQGCDIAVLGVNKLQNLAGQHVVRSPDLGANAGFNYETDFQGLKFGLTGDANYTSWYFFNAYNAPLMKQKSYWLADASVRIGAPDDRWQVALIGRNLFDQAYVVRGAQVPGSGGASGGVAAATQADVMGAIGRGREVMLRLTVRPDRF